MKRFLLLAALLLLAGCAAPSEPEPTETQTVTVATEAPTLPPETEPVVFDTVPVYYQTDYPYTRYSNGTIGSSGCGITCLAMVATYMTDRVYTPDMIAWEFGGYGENNIQRLDYTIEQMQLPCEKKHDWRLTKQALEEGAIAIILVDERSEFTTSSHFILLRGINEAGRYEVIDPFGPNYSEDYLREGFEKGFTEGQILAGLEGSWVFRKENSTGFCYPIEMPHPIVTRYRGFQPTDKDIDFLARFVWAAAREEPAETKQAVAELVLNRMVSPRYPDRVEDVMSQEALYIWYRQIGRAQPELEHYQAVTGAIYGPHILPMDVVHGAPWPTGGGKTWGNSGSFTFCYERE